MKYKKLAASLLGTMMMVTQTLPAYAVQPEKVRVLADEQTAGETVLRASFDGDASDASGRGNNGTIVGSPEFVDGISGKAIHIVNSNGGTMETAKQYVDFGNGNDFKFGTEDFSIKFWTRTPAGGGEGAGLISNKDYSAGGNTGFQIVYFLNGVRSNFRAQGKPRKDVQNIMPLDDHWHEMIINYDRDGMMTIFRDGKQVGQANIADNAGASIDAGNLVVGADGYLHKGISDGYFDELTIVRGLMDTTNARKEYAEGISGYALRQAKSLIEKAEGIGSLNKAVIDAAKEKRSALEALLAAGGDEEVITAAEALVNACDGWKPNWQKTRSRMPLCCRRPLTEMRTMHPDAATTEQSSEIPSLSRACTAMRFTSSTPMEALPKPQNNTSISETETTSSLARMISRSNSGRKLLPAVPRAEALSPIKTTVPVETPVSRRPISRMAAA